MICFGLHLVRDFILDSILNPHLVWFGSVLRPCRMRSGFNFGKERRGNWSPLSEETFEYGT